MDKGVIDGVLKRGARLVQPPHAFRDNLTNFETRAPVFHGAIDIIRSHCVLRQLKFVRNGLVRSRGRLEPSGA